MVPEWQVACAIVIAITAGTSTLFSELRDGLKIALLFPRHKERQAYGVYANQMFNACFHNHQASHRMTPPLGGLGSISMLGDREI